MRPIGKINQVGYQELGWDTACVILGRIDASDEFYLDNHDYVYCAETDICVGCVDDDGTTYFLRSLDQDEEQIKEIHKRLKVIYDSVNSDDF